MTLDATARATAARLIEAFGTPAVLRRVTAQHDPATGKVSETSADLAIKVSPPENFREGLVDGTLVKAGDLSAQLAAKDLAAVPVPARDLILIGGKAYALVRIDTVMSGAEVALYRLHLRA